ncbi:MAG: hypothetical protein ACLUJG_18395 [Lawsonibacter sp.]
MRAIVVRPALVWRVADGPMPVVQPGSGGGADWFSGSSTRRQLEQAASRAQCLFPALVPGSAEGLCRLYR